SKPASNSATGPRAACFVHLFLSNSFCPLSTRLERSHIDFDDLIERSAMLINVPFDHDQMRTYPVQLRSEVQK
ncbi:hypothetical protein, partial [Brevibacillus reuszeri]|uniref:hypothetical protein n=1 Tax=Brevibacillus reuszeri TaxID=54915 RepID=UPI003D1F6455